MLYDEIVSRTPVAGGWSPDRKYCAETADGTRYFLRIAAPDRAERMEQVFRAEERAAALGIPMPRPVACGTCPEGFCTLEEWIDGRDARQVLPDLTEAELYAHGLEAGKILRRLHSLPAPADLPAWAHRFNAKIDRRIRAYLACPLRYETDAPFFAYLEENRRLLEGRPQCFQHGDFHVGNFLFRNGRLLVIDFDRFGYGDPWEDFDRVVWCAEAAPSLARGMVDGYFRGQIPPEFWRLLALYLCCGMLSNLPWAIPFGEGEIAVMRSQARRVLAWYDGLRTSVPLWYTEGGR